MTVAAIVCTYNRANLLPGCLDSLLNQTRSLDEIIVVNDGSTDDTAEAVAPYLDRITYLEKENGGKAQSLNHALKVCRSDYVLIIDDDDLALENSVELHLDAIEADGDCAITYSGAHFADDDGSGGLTVESRWHMLDTSGGEFFSRLLESCTANTGAMLIKRACFDAVGPFREDMLRCQDYDMLLRLTRRFRTAIVRRPTLVLRRHAGARGTASFRFSEDERSRVSLSFDKKILRPLYDQLALSEYLPDGVPHEPEGVFKRRALLQRACVMARHGLWDQFLADVRSLKDALGAEQELSEAERQICQRTFSTSGHDFVIDEMLDRRGLAAEVARNLAGGTGRAVRIEYAKSLYYLLRDRFSDWPKRKSFGALAVAVRMLGVDGLWHSALHKLGVRNDSEGRG
ncbi:MAG: glycosyltransferase family 2 protein [Sphingomonadales bacterium]|nr:glycosyltransferase family 2 protein [Sphingomonadales bacterium]